MKDIGQSTAVRGTRGLVFEECRIEAVPTTVLQVAGYEGCDSEVFIPSEAFGLPVAMIAEGAFAFCDKIKKVTIDSGIGYIGDRAFYRCKTLESVILPDSLELLGNGAFEECGELSIVALPSALAEIPKRAFADCPLDTITLPRNLSVIGEEAFRNCKFSDISLPPQLKTIGPRAFLDCWQLSRVTIPIGVKSIYAEAFSVSASNPNRWYYKMKIYCETKLPPTGWEKGWCGPEVVVVWNCPPNARRMVL